MIFGLQILIYMRRNLNKLSINKIVMISNKNLLTITGLVIIS